MLFSSILFLVWFLPLTFGIYFLSPKSWRNAVLLIASLIFYGWASPYWLLLILADCLVGYLCCRMMENRSRKVRKAALIIGVIFCSLLLFVFKYYNFFAGPIADLSGLDLLIPSLVLPAGISFYTFQVISVLADVYTKRAPAQHSFIRFCLYICMFFQLIAGPIVRYSDIEPELDHRSVHSEDLQSGASRFICGLGKKVLIANPLSAISSAFRTGSSVTVLGFWINAVCVSLYIYYDFSGYSDMAIGLGRMMGFHLPENFRYPFTAGTITDFWRRWHMSLTTWFRDYVYIPLGGNRKGKSRQLFNLFVVWMLTGLWHGAAWNYVLWGLSFFIWISLEKFVFPGKLTDSVLYHGITVLIILVSFLLFQDASLQQFAADLQAMSGLCSLPFSSTETLYVLRSSLVLLIVSILGATPIPLRIKERLDRHLSFQFLLPAGGLMVLLLSLASLAYGAANPFLYFQF